jgi:Tfp pilus assembly protein PilF
MLGDFAGSAQSYKTLLTEYSSAQPEDERSFTDALAATRSRTAAAEFDAFREHYTAHSDSMAITLRVDSAGLHLMGGDPKLAEPLQQELLAVDKEYTPELLARLAWWQYRAGNPQRSSQLFEQAIQLRPQEGRYRVALAWAELEQHRYADAMEHSHFLSGYAAESTALTASVQWYSNEKESALREYESLAADPSWSNRHWVEGNYSMMVVSAMDQMKQERERRLTARKR